MLLNEFNFIIQMMPNLWILILLITTYYSIYNLMNMKSIKLNNKMIKMKKF